MTRLRTSLAALALVSTAMTPALAQRREATPEQRIDRLEKQVRQVQKQVFPKGQPVDTAGFSDEPAASQATADALAARMDAVERQMADLQRAVEENTNRVSTLETELFRMRADTDKRLRAQETGGAPTAETTDDGNAAPVEEASDPAPKTSRPKVETKPKAAPAGKPVSPTDASFDSGAEAAYDAGFQMWTRGDYADAHDALIAMAKKYPGHRRVSWAYNLAGRSLLDQGKYRAAAEELLANYRRDPKGERAQDSVFYLGQSLVKLGQPAQACKAYGELEEVYRGQIRPQLAALIPAAKAQAKCK